MSPGGGSGQGGALAGSGGVSVGGGGAAGAGLGGLGGTSVGGAGQGSAGGASGAGGASATTTLRVHYPVEAGHALTVRGDQGGLDWGAGVAMTAGAEHVWTFSTSTVVGQVEWKPLLDDGVWARGPNYVAQAGTTVDVYPHFQVTSGQVTLFREQFASAQLPDARDVWVYLPPTYVENATARFPVLYMHDGQNLFDPAKAFGGVEWQVDEAMDAGAESGKIREAIVVGVGNTAARIHEYTPVEDAEYTPSGGGDKYLALLAEELKPLVDAELRTLPGAADTGLVGSSLGGLISAHGGVKRPEVFGLVGALSPSTWWANLFLVSEVGTVAQASLRARRVYVDSGDAGDSQDGVASTAKLAAQYQAVGYTLDKDLRYLVQAGAQHNEFYWAQRFPGAAAFLLGSRPDSGSEVF